MNAKLPNIINIILIATLVAAMGGNIGPFRATGFAWLIPLILSAYLLVQNKFKITFPVWTALPWVIVVLFNCLRLDYENSLQRAIMLLCPFVVGCAISTIPMTEELLEKYLKSLRYFCIGLFIVILYKSGTLFNLHLPDTSPLAAEVMIGMILISIFTTNYFYGCKTDKWYILGLLIVPFIALTRMAMMTTALTLPLNFSKISLAKRAAFLGIMFLGGLFVLNTERVQKKMFYTDARHFKKMDVFGLFATEGFNMFEDMKNDPCIATSGREFIWANVSNHAKNDHLFGKGIGACENFVSRLTYKSVKYPHNDWLLTYYDMGAVGVALLAITIILMGAYAFWAALKTSGIAKVLLLGMSYSFIPFTLMMITDNILVYASFFGNLQYCTLAMAYSKIKQDAIIAEENKLDSYKKNKNILMNNVKIVYDKS